MATAFDFSAETIDGFDKQLGDYRGSVLLIVNVASQCGFTPQYGPLQNLHEKYADQGLVVLGFPCDQFGHQEPGDNDEIAAFCESHYGVTFPLFAKIDVNGKDAHPLYRWLKSEQGGMLVEAIKWNFTKFLVDRQGNVVRRYGSGTSPEDIAGDIAELL